jgi:hypothetical protein
MTKIEIKENVNRPAWRQRNPTNLPRDARGVVIKLPGLTLGLDDTLAKVWPDEPKK